MSFRHNMMSQSQGMEKGEKQSYGRVNMTFLLGEQQVSGYWKTPAGSISAAFLLASHSSSSRLLDALDDQFGVAGGDSIPGMLEERSVP